RRHRVRPHRRTPAPQLPRGPGRPQHDRVVRDHGAQRQGHPGDGGRGRAAATLERLGDRLQHGARRQARRTARRVRPRGARARGARARVHGALPLAGRDDAVTALVDHVVHGDAHELRLARPPVNALDPALCAALAGAIDDALARGARGLVLSGGPKVLAAGLDVPFLVGLGADRAGLRAGWDAFFRVARARHAPAGGCVLALCCDYRVMAHGPFSIGLNETQVGLVAPDGIQHLLRRVVGPRVAERLLVAGELVPAEQALAMGLVDELVDVDHVAVRARAWVEQLLALPSAPMLETRRLARADLVAALQPERIELDRFID